MQASTAERDFTRYLESVGGDLSIPDRTPLHFIVMPVHGIDRFQEEQEAVVQRSRRAQDRAGIESKYCVTLGWRENRFRFPHGIPWTAFPVVMDPHYVLPGSAVLNDCAAGRPVPAISFEAANALRRCTSIFVHVDSGWSDALREERMLALSDILHSASTPDLFLVEGNEVAPIAASDLIRGDVDIAARKRFEYSYALNFRAIIGRALIHALEATLDSLSDETPANATQKNSDRGRRRMLIARLEGGGFKGFDSPLFLQALYRIRRLGPISLLSKSASIGPALLVETAPGVYAWEGKGAQPAALFSKQELLEFLMAGGALNELLMRHEDGTVELSEAGDMFLDLLHPDAEDPNVLCRWANRILTDKDRIAMDRWVETTFRKVKTRVNMIDRRLVGGKE